MMRFAAISILLAATATAHADAKFYNATSNTLTVEATFPNGKVEKIRVSDGSESVSSGYFLSPPGVDKLGIRIFDDVGTELWKGSAGPNDVHVTIPDGKGTKTMFAGLYAGGFDTPKAALFLNLTGEAMTLDLEGMNGLGAHRGVTPGGFDPKQLVRLDPKESYFTAIIKTSTDSTKINGTKVTPGHYYIVSKHPRDKYRLLSLGYLIPPASAKK
jgi:hypothetical protein